ncbi:hypothetical protein EDD17DRAFT_1872725 [Pisolithus thermaeus]|nr:hypothetical protein EDD17DRAFT_1872725 [Pisolithus thermaeus]
MSTATSTTPTTAKSPNPSSNDTLSVRLTQGVTKDVRAHEHARHRAKERQEHAQAKERKEKAAMFRALGFKVSSSTGGHGGKPAAARRPRVESWDGDELDVSPWIKSSYVPLEPAAAPLRSGAGPFSELTLADLISFPPQEKAKKLDFEVIPPVRAVIALDDDTDDTESDEPWEYITRASLNNELPQKGRSYAQAAAAH